MRTPSAAKPPGGPGAQTLRQRVRSFWHRRGRAALRRAFWPFVVALVVLTTVLAWIGFEESSAVLGQPTTFAGNLYRILQLFDLHLGEIASPVPWQLEVARFLAPVLAFGAAVIALKAVLDTQWSAFRARRATGHVVICGLGRLGSRTARAFAATGWKVVAVEADPNSAAIGLCREDGIRVLVGDATDPSVLRIAGVPRAQFVVAVTGDDNANAKVAIEVRRLVGGRTGLPLTCLIHVADEALISLLNEIGLSGKGGDPFRLEAFNAAERGARAILEAYPAFDGNGMTSLGRPHILLVGLGELGSRLVVDAGRRWRTLDFAGRRRLRITVVDNRASTLVASLAERYPRLADACDIRVLDMDLASPAFERGDFLFDAHGNCDVTGVYIGVGEDVTGLGAALRLRRRLGGRPVPIVVRTTQEGGAAAFLGSDGEHATVADLVVFGLIELVARPEVLLHGQNEVLAEAIHSHYLRQHAGEAPENPSAVPWEWLKGPLQESNRDQAADYGRKLRAVSCDIEPLTDWDIPAVVFSADEIDRLARMEHERWVAERRTGGWHLGRDKDVDRLITPYLVPYDELPPEQQANDRAAVLAMPSILAYIGFTIVREGPAA